MKKMTIQEIEQHLFVYAGKEKDTLIQTLRMDERKGVQKILDRWERLQEKQQFLHEKFVEMTSFEENLRQQGFRFIAGIDEAGRVI